MRLFGSCSFNGLCENPAMSCSCRKVPLHHYLETISDLEQKLRSDGNPFSGGTCGHSGGCFLKAAGVWLWHVEFGRASLHARQLQVLALADHPAQVFVKTQHGTSVHHKAFNSYGV